MARSKRPTEPADPRVTSVHRCLRAAVPRCSVPQTKYLDALALSPSQMFRHSEIFWAGKHPGFGGAPSRPGTFVLNSNEKENQSLISQSSPCRSSDSIYSWGTGVCVSKCCCVTGVVGESYLVKRASVSVVGTVTLCARGIWTRDCGELAINLTRDAKSSRVTNVVTAKGITSARGWRSS